MTKNEFKYKIEYGSDIMFDVCGKHFTIVTWLDDGIGIDEQAPHNTGVKIFKTPNDLLDNYRVNNIPLSELCDKIIITDYS